VRARLICTRGWGGFDGDGVFRVTVAGITVDGRAEPVLGMAFVTVAGACEADAGLQAASKQLPASALADSMRLVMLTRICFRGYRRLLTWT
jgi:hypothetical protein